jgi:hypothetical protein
MNDDDDDDDDSDCIVLYLCSSSVGGQIAGWRFLRQGYRRIENQNESLLLSGGGPLISHGRADDLGSEQASK